MNIGQPVTLQSPRFSWKILCTTVGSSLFYWVLCFLCLVRWQSGDHWSRFDIFSGSYLAIKLLGSVHSLYSGRGAFRSEDIRKEWWGTTSSSKIVRSTVWLMIGDLLVLFDYGHWQSLRILAHPAIQAVGLALYVLAKFWQMWTDGYLASYFDEKQGLAEGGVMKNGPFRYIRHPRYAGVIAGKAGCALIFASIFGWLSLIGWGIVYVRKVEREEERMKQLTGMKYGSYSKRTARLIPGIY